MSGPLNHCDRCGRQRLASALYKKMAVKQSGPLGALILTLILTSSVCTGKSASFHILQRRGNDHVLLRDDVTILLHYV